MPLPPLKNKGKPKLLSVQELADYLGMNRQTVYRLVRSGEIPAIRVGTDYRLDLEEVRDALKVRPENN